MRRLVLILICAFALAGCGGGGGGGEAQETTPPGTEARTITVKETEYKLDPSTVRLDKPGTYSFRGVNDGKIDHALEVEGNGVEEETETFGPGASATLTVKLDKEGTYELYCPVDSHKQLGMVGKIVVGSGSAGGGTTTGKQEGTGY